MAQQLKRIISKLNNAVIVGKEKAVYAFVVSTIGTYLAQSGLTIDQVLSWHGLNALVVGVATHFFVYQATNTSVGE